MPRFDAVDALRGLAMVWMTAFHFCFDLNQFGYIKQDFYRDPLWTWQRTLILSLFLFCAGLGQAIAVNQAQSWPRFWHRWARVLGCALLVTAGSWWMYPQSFIYFGVLQGMALMLILARLTANWGRWLWLLGAIAIALKYLAVSILETGSMSALADALNTAQLNWLGLVTRKPITEDYVPLLPWLGVMWWGVAAGNWLTKPGVGRLTWQLPVTLQPLVTLGRWSLSYYVLHQPVMIGALMALAWLSK
ncbi:MAG: heparan-alpha-glucosaminide N-acetyltransferase [Comamonadaceae bacterium]